MCVLLDTIIKGFGRILDATTQLNYSLMKELGDYVTNEVEAVYVDMLNNIAKSRGINIAELILIEYENLFSRPFVVNVVATNSAGSASTNVTIQSSGLAPEEDLATPLQANHANDDHMKVKEISDNYKSSVELKLSRLKSTLRHLANTRKYLIDIRSQRLSDGKVFSFLDDLIDVISSYIDTYDNFIRVKSIEEAINVIDFEKLELFDKYLQEVYNESFIETEIELGGSSTERVVFNDRRPPDSTTLINTLNSIAPECFCKLA